MAELIPAPFADLVHRLHREPQVQDTLFGLPRRRWCQPEPDGPDLSVTLNGRRAGTPLGPAAGPHTQMAQNLLLSYVAGGRILELKTVQVNDQLTIPRPCIDMAGVGYNAEWSQELRLAQSAQEYVAGAMLIEMFRHGPHGRAAGLVDAAGDFILDVSVGYDLAGIRSPRMVEFLESLRDAETLIEALRAEIPRKYAAARQLDFPARLAAGLTLSTFHGCPADEIERIAEFLMVERAFDVCVKLNPSLLGRARLEHLLHDVLGYTDVALHPQACTAGLDPAMAGELCRRLAALAARSGRHFGVKLCNTLEICNRGSFLPQDQDVVYLSGPPLYVLMLALADALRQVLGADLPFSCSGGVDKGNVADVVAAGFRPVTMCTDLLRPGGYGRLPAYLQRLSAEMRAVSAPDIAGFIHARAGQGAAAESLPTAARRNLADAARQALTTERYRAAQVNRPLPRLESALRTFDCITCDKCIPVCPNAAIFSYPSTPTTLAGSTLLVEPSGQWHVEPNGKPFVIERKRQIAVYADFCNECGNCDTFCPEQGAPYRDKPGFHGSLDSWQRAAPRDAFVVTGGPQERCLHARMAGRVYLLAVTAPAEHRFEDGPVDVVLDAATGHVRRVNLRAVLTATVCVDLGVYYTLAALLTGVLDPRQINQINVARCHHEPV